MRIVLSVGNLLVSIFLVLSCGGERGSTIGSFAKEANLPLYFTITGTTFGTGAVYKIPDLQRGALAKPELVASGLDFPTGLAMNSKGEIFVTEKLPTPDGKVKKIDVLSGDITVELANLHNPISVAFDTFDRLYVTQGDSNLIQKADAQQQMQDFKVNEIGLPRDVYINQNDDVFITELLGGIVSQLSQDGTRKVITQNLINPFGLAYNLKNDLHVLVNNSGGTDGQLLKVSESGETEIIIDSLINPIGLTYNNAHGFFIIEGDPANRIINFSEKTGELTIIANTAINPYAIIMTPF